MAIKKKIKKENTANEWGFEEFDFDILTNSARSTFLNCRMKFYWQYICRLSPIKVAVPLVVGALFHDGLELFYSPKGLDLDSYGEEVQKKLEEHMDCISSDEEATKLRQQEALVMGMLAGYIKRYSKQDKDKWKVIAPETDFCFDIPNSSLKYAGKRDLLVTSKAKKDDTILVEHKTTSKLDSSYLAKLPLDNQILLYSKSVEIDTGALPKHIVYNVVKKSGIKMKQSETLQQYYDRMQMEYLYNLESMYYREIIPTDKRSIREAAEDLSKCANEIERCIYNTKYYYRNTTHCTAYGTCHFMPLCVKANDAKYQYTIRESAHAELDIENTNE